MANGSNANENKMVGKKIDPLKERISCSFTLPGKLKSTSTTCSLSDGKSLGLKVVAVRNEVNHSNNKAGTKLRYEKKKARDMVHEKDSNL
ncbi:hypothetical protein AVEN_7799-1 [Araneus ventricosus]|uniref:Uncharacterized protein n=1 Tax=Araneus ventricosus TaxID=182803 RepID=A0A4Y2VWW1_ARAVE|nr:hypothetical protein AVEN_237403-1 [Araneus ventricosus]GBO28798.1 hypothetical protein AVEN_178657-1 [Araneus ventricosus]GBO33071.1 hypothetical protein AVEN_125222-1 [Araneus ventricosus]GBO33073.1 hypothetical protein AVEN_7799-1 [Araneus ventricosus]